jgi:two-component system, cell cycle sensor histidine kinase and response regulator CckA
VGSGQGPTVLVVDDEPQVRALSARVLVDAGFDVLDAGDAVEALARLQAPGGSEIRLVITDIVMPGMQGDEFGRLIRYLRPALPVLYMSGYARPDLDEVLSPTELEQYWLAKPFRPSELVQKARVLCDGAQSIQ